MTRNITTEDDVKKTFAEIIGVINKDIQKAATEADCDRLEGRLQQFEAVFLTVTAGIAELVVSGIDTRHFGPHRTNLTAVRQAIKPVRDSIKAKRTAICKDLSGESVDSKKEAKDAKDLNAVLEKEKKRI